MTQPYYHIWIYRSHRNIESRNQLKKSPPRQTQEKIIGDSPQKRPNKVVIDDEPNIIVYLSCCVMIKNAYAPDEKRYRSFILSVSPWIFNSYHENRFHATGIQIVTLTDMNNWESTERVCELMRRKVINTNTQMLKSIPCLVVEWQPKKQLLYAILN